MKLLTKNEIKVKKASEIAQKVQFNVKVTDQLTKDRKALNEFKILKVTEEKRLLEELHEFRLEIGSKRGTLQQEVDSLEERRKDALRPVKQLITKAEKVLKKNEAQEEKLRIDSNDLATDKILYTLERKKVEMREEEVVDKTTDLKAKKADLDERDKNLKKLEKSFSQYSTKEKELFEDKSRKLDTNLKVVTQKQESLDVLKKEAEKAKASLRKERVKLEDQQQTLKVAFDEARKKNLL